MSRGTTSLREAGIEVESAPGCMPLLALDTLVWCTICGRVDEFGALRVNVRARRPELRCGTCSTAWGSEHLGAIVWWSDARDVLREMGRLFVEPSAGWSFVCPPGFWERW